MIFQKKLSKALDIPWMTKDDFQQVNMAMVF